MEEEVQKVEEVIQTEEVKVNPMVAVIESWFQGHISPMAHRFEASVYNDFQLAKEELKRLLLDL